MLELVCFGCYNHDLFQCITKLALIMDNRRHREATSFRNPSSSRHNSNRCSSSRHHSIQDFTVGLPLMPEILWINDKLHFQMEITIMAVTDTRLLASTKEAHLDLIRATRVLRITPTGQWRDRAMRRNLIMDISNTPVHPVHLPCRQRRMPILDKPTCRIVGQYRRRR